MRSSFGWPRFVPFSTTSLCVGLFAVSAAAQNLVVTVVGHDGSEPSLLRGDDLNVEVGHHPAGVCDWIKLRGEHAALQLYVVIDDGTTTQLGLQYRDFKNYLESLPETTQVGLAYLQNGRAAIAAPLTTDHAEVAGKLRVPLGEAGIAASPYMGISDLIGKWPEAGNVRREILYIGSGIDPYSPHDPENLYLKQAIAKAERAGILVNSIAFGAAGRRGFGLANWGQNYLSEIAEATGGEAYWQGTINPVSIAPYLKQFNRRLDNQYLLTVDASSPMTGLEPVRVTTSRARVSLSYAPKIYMGS